MNASEFNTKCTEIYNATLITNGFHLKRNSLFYQSTDSTLALLRINTKWSGLTQSTGFVLCIRHNFLRDIEGNIQNEFVFNPNEYPFKLRPSVLNSQFLNKWRYRPINLGLRSDNYDLINYGSSNDVMEIINNIVINTSTFGMEMLEYLTPSKAYEQIKRYGEKAACEATWLEDYKQLVNKPEKGSKLLSRLYRRD